MEILAVISIDRTRVGGGAPIFYVQNEEEAAELAVLISNIFGAAAHDLNNGVLIIVRH